MSDTIEGASLLDEVLKSIGGPTAVGQLKTATELHDFLKPVKDESLKTKLPDKKLDSTDFQPSAK